MVWVGPGCYVLWRGGVRRFQFDETKTLCLLWLVMCGFRGRRGELCGLEDPLLIPTFETQFRFCDVGAGSPSSEKANSRLVGHRMRVALRYHTNTSIIAEISSPSSVLVGRHLHCFECLPDHHAHTSKRLSVVLISRFYRHTHTRDSFHIFYIQQSKQSIIYIYIISS